VRKALDRQVDRRARRGVGLYIEVDRKMTGITIAGIELRPMVMRKINAAGPDENEGKREVESPAPGVLGERLNHERRSIPRQPSRQPDLR